MRRTRFQQGSLQIVKRAGGRKAWEYRWYELQADGSRTRRNLMVGSLEQYGSRHIGIRAKDLIYAFLQLSSNISELSDAIGLPCTQEEVGQFKTDDIKYRGWWVCYAASLLSKSGAGC